MGWRRDLWIENQKERFSCSCQPNQNSFDELKYLVRVATELELTLTSSEVVYHQHEFSQSKENILRSKNNSGNSFSY